MSPIRSLIMAAGLVPSFAALAQNGPSQLVPPDKGSIDPSGKFVPTGSTPRRTAAEAAADETRQRESLKVPPDGPGRYRIGELALDRVRREVKVNVSWETNDPTVQHELANLVVTADRPDAAANPKPLASGPWRYTSSTLGPAGFAAAVEGSVISRIQYPAALVVNPRADASLDEIHTANSSLIPPKGSPVRIIPAPPKPSASPAKP